MIVDLRALGLSHRHVAGALGVSYSRVAQLEEDARIGHPARLTGGTMTMLPREPVTPSGHLEIPVQELLERAKLWDPAEQPVIDDLTDDDEAEFLAAITR